MKTSTLFDGLKPVVFGKTKDGYRISWDGYWVEMSEEDIINYNPETTEMHLGGIYGLLQTALINEYKDNK